MLKELQLNQHEYKSAKNLKALLLNVQKEIEAPLYIDLHSISKTVGVIVPKMTMISNALTNGGYKVSRSHISQTSIKTNAPMDFIWDIFRTLHKQSNTKNKKYLSDENAKKILDNEIKNEISFKNNKDFSLNVGKNKLYVNNPKYWGPGAIGKPRNTNLNVQSNPAKIKEHMDYVSSKDDLQVDSQKIEDEDMERGEGDKKEVEFKFENIQEIEMDLDGTLVTKKRKLED